MFWAQTSGELGSGTLLGFVLRVKRVFEASSSASVEQAPLVAKEGAVLAIMCSMPALVSSEVVRGGVIADGDMAAKCQRLEEKEINW